MAATENGPRLEMRRSFHQRQGRMAFVVLEDLEGAQGGGECGECSIERKCCAKKDGAPPRDDADGLGLYGRHRSQTDASANDQPSARGKCNVRSGSFRLRRMAPDRREYRQAMKVSRRPRTRPSLVVTCAGMCPSAAGKTAARLGLWKGVAGTAGSRISSASYSCACACCGLLQCSKLAPGSAACGPHAHSS
jgi:hypothetical protein